MRYRDSGVDIDKANEAKKAIRSALQRTWGAEVLSDVGHFGGLFRMPALREPVLVSSMDGVGTKLLVARMAERYDTVGQCLVNHCVNDILVQGARPLFFLDYIAAGRLRPEVVAGLVEGLARACEENGCALIGGETAEMPDLYQRDDFDLAGAIVGVVERDALVDGSGIRPGDRVLALPSSGLHTNGYSLARRIVFDVMGQGIDDRVGELGCTVGEELLKVHRSYLREVTALMEAAPVKGLAHVTGGGVVENLPRVLPVGCGARVEKGTWPVPPVFPFLQRHGEVDEAEMYRVFNMGLGMLAVVGAEDAARVPSSLAGTPLYAVGEVVAGAGVAFS
ncbi:MAG: phosphoribosylformylglycinamidine cyclo-ligase [Candidatus Krumholzibacteria bacterium]|nr:phosphoribosylformylglycinamidine cyclo-ligase [Candidatus Krumholzibacteria bacterium]